jgi:hypothetical protein
LKNRICFGVLLSLLILPIQAKAFSCIEGNADDHYQQKKILNAITADIAFWGQEESSGIYKVLVPFWNTYPLQRVSVWGPRYSRKEGKPRGLIIANKEFIKDANKEFYVEIRYMCHQYTHFHDMPILWLVYPVSLIRWLILVSCIFFFLIKISSFLKKNSITEKN